MGMGKEGCHVIPKISQKMGVVEVKRKYRIIHIHILNLACIETEETENDSG